MKRMPLVLTLVIALLGVSMYCMPINSAYGEDVETAFKPFLGKWEGDWVWGSGGRPCKLFVYLDNGQGYVDYYLGPVKQVHTGQHSSVNNSDQQNKIKAEVKEIKGSHRLVFTSKSSGFEIQWFPKDGQLIGVPIGAPVADSKCTLSKVQ